MNKKYLSVILFSALMLGTTGTFTSCKDYDDDINSLTERIEGVEGDLEELKTDFGNLAYVTGVSYVDGVLTVTTTNGTNNYTIPDNNTTYSLSGTTEGNKVTITLTGSDGKSSTYTMEVNGGVAFDATLLTVGEDNYIYYDGQKTGVQIPKEAEVAVGVIEKDGEVVGYTFTYEGKTTQLMIASATLNSLVFAPDFYYQGIEAMRAATFIYDALALGTVDANGDYKEDAPTTGSTVEMTPGLTANYHLNPTNVNPDYLPTANLSFIADDKAYTKAGVVVPQIYKSSIKAGMLTVKAHLTEGTIKDIEKDGKVTVLALQAGTKNATKGDTLITSDYAAVKKAEITDLTLDNAKLEGCNHWYTKAKDAIDNEAAIEMAWNSNGIDIAEYVQAHYKENGTHKAWDVNAKDGIVKEDGFKYIFELVGYYQGQNETSASAHANWTAANSTVLRPQMTVNGQQAGYNGEQNRASIGREPLVRVILKDTISEQNAAVAYIKVKIVDSELENKVTVIDPFVITDGYTVNCSNADLTKKLSWHQIEERIIAHADLSISKEEFEKNYKLDGFIEDTTPATQFTNTTMDATPVTTALGKVIKTVDDTEPTMTEVLAWTLGANEAYETFTAQESASVIVRFTKTNDNDTKHYVYVTLTWKPNPRNVTPAGKVDDNSKLAEYWFAKGQSVGKTGYHEVHFNVATPTTASDNNSANCTFKKDVFDVFDATKAMIVGIDEVYADFQDAKLKKNFKFITPDVTPVKGVSGTTYYLGVSADGLKFMASTITPFSELTATAIAVMNNNVVTYQENNVAKDLLNYASHKELGEGETLTAKIEVVASACGGTDQISTKNVKLENETFDVRFLRPISIEMQDNDGVVDGKDGGDEVALADILSFIDWRNYAFAENTHLFGFYGVESIALDVTKITTNLNNGTLGNNGTTDGGTLLKDKYPNVDVTFTEATSVDLEHMGTITWKNNGQVVGKDFIIRLPIIVTYKWGTIAVKNIDVTVHPTVGQ